MKNNLNDLNTQDCQKNLEVYVGRRIREKRQKMGLTLSELAVKINISQQQIQKYEQAQSRISSSTLYQLGKILGVETSYFFHGFEGFSKKSDTLGVDEDIILSQRQRPLNILLVEDSASDELFLREALTQSAVKVNILSIHDGMTALDFLRNRSTDIMFPRPDVILLDLTIPKYDGSSVLKEIKRDRELTDIPVVIITHSISFSEMLGCYRLGASGYICKPFDQETFAENMDVFVRYWAYLVCLPCRACVKKQLDTLGWIE